jgi:hypothetical protein
MAPDDPIGTVRATDGVLAIRAHGTEDLAWFAVDISDDAEHQLDPADFDEDLIATWPIVYQP